MPDADFEHLQGLTSSQQGQLLEDLTKRTSGVLSLMHADMVASGAVRAA
jgi:hypothetical protein